MYLNFLIDVVRLLISAHVVFVQASDGRPPVNATLQVTGAVGWRREGLVYKKNEVQMRRNFSFSQKFSFPFYRLLF